LALAAAFACGPSSLPPTGQIVLYVNTDAPLPPASGGPPSSNAPTPLFDSIRIEVYFPGASTPCPTCTHETFPFDLSIVGQGHASVGIVPTPGVSGYRARVRLFTAAWETTGEPNPATTLDTTVALPEVQENGITEVTVTLHTDDVGKPIGRQKPIAPELGRPKTGLAGTWPGSRRVGCATPARAGEACIPGGAFWMDPPGSQLGTVESVSVLPRLVVLSPFLLSLTEVSVGAFRASGLQTSGDPSIDSGMGCTFTSEPGRGEDFPVVCVSWNKARDYCNSVSGDLPTSAEFQYVASGLVSNPFVWGSDLPSCGGMGGPPDAEFGHSYSFTTGAMTTTGECLIFGGVSRPGRGRRDRLLVPGDDSPVVDLAGNASEWGLEPFNEGRGECWGTGVYRDPVCTSPSVPSKTLLGGSIITGAAELVATSRSAQSPSLSEPFIGFRCARPAR
jgi:hypothetical protein